MAENSAYTLEDLQSWSTASENLKKKGRLAVFGDPVAHSLSPQMHNPGLEAAGIDSEYVRLHIAPDDLQTALRELPKQGFIGTNLTIPHKSAAARIVDDLTGTARRTGAVNTVLVDPETGKLTGHSTDGPGFQRAIREEFSVDLRDLRILILGAGGGAGRAVAVQCAMERCERLVLANRTLATIESLEKDLASFFRDESLQKGLDGTNKQDARVASVYNNLGVLYYSKHDFDRACEFHSEALSIRKKLFGNNGHHYDLGQSYNNLAAVHKAMGDYDTAADYFAKVEELGDLVSSNRPNRGIDPESGMGEIVVE